MKFKQLIFESKNKLDLNPILMDGSISLNVFDSGAKWMFEKLNENNLEGRFNDSTNYLTYGVFKYGICFCAFIISFLLFSRINFLLIPLSVLVFYLFEIHFLFLFPLLIDNVQNPVWTSIKQTYKIGIITALVTVIPIGFFMVAGLLKFSDPFRNWYVGCLAILIWYQNEIRDRV